MWVSVGAKRVSMQYGLKHHKPWFDDKFEILLDVIAHVTMVAESKSN
jgi:hypothetical protein